jgi:flagellar basal-body rod modification protein FlgD
MTVTPVSSAQNNTTTTPVVNAPQTLGSADFMKLLAVQFQSQDPLKPMDDTAFIAQMAQFTSLQQTQTMTTQMTKLSATQDLVAANSYLGQMVTVDDGNGGTASGIVSGVQVDSTGPKIVVNNNPYSISSVLFVQPGTVSPPATTATPSANAGGA